MFDCENCGKSYSRADNLKRHVRTSCVGKRLKLNRCQQPSNTRKCDFCNIEVNQKSYSAHLRSNAHKSKALVITDDGVEKIAGAFGNKIVSYRVSVPRHHIDLNDFNNDVREKILTLIESVRYAHNSVKVNLECFALYYLANHDDAEIKSFNTRNVIITSGVDLCEIYRNFSDEISAKMSEFQERDSGKIKFLVSMLKKK